MFVKAGSLDRPIVIHTAVALHPALRPQLNDPRGMSSILADADVVRAGTRFLFIHTGYPSHDAMAAMASQFPSVSVDLSFFSHFPGVLEETLRTLLAIVPPHKIMHGSDSGSVPEDPAYCAHNLRVALARLLNDYRSSYGWSESDCSKIATAVMNENARRFFRIRSA
jgi:predicted TIM-barrel fold metal-dependent hydrolase